MVTRRAAIIVHKLDALRWFKCTKKGALRDGAKDNKRAVFGRGAYVAVRRNRRPQTVHYITSRGPAAVALFKPPNMARWCHRYESLLFIDLSIIINNGRTATRCFCALHKWPRGVLYKHSCALVQVLHVLHGRPTAPMHFAASDMS